MNELSLEYSPHFQELAGVNDKNLKRIEKRFDVSIFVRNNRVCVRGDEEENVKNAESLLTQIIELFDDGQDLNNGALKFLIPAFHDDPDIKLKEIFDEKIALVTGKSHVTPRSVTQREYVFAISRFDIVIAIGPAGTGKTYLAMASAVSDLLQKKVSRIILVRPAVEAGEKLGFLPGDLYEKITPYLRPLHDALFDMMEPDKVSSMIEQGMIEIAPLAYMRGRTLNDAFIILDEAQNATLDQMKMFLTRLGLNSKAVITGDITQIDLPSKANSGLVKVKSILKDIAGIRFVNFTERDVVRHELVKKILKAYENEDQRIKDNEKQSVRDGK